MFVCILGLYLYGFVSKLRTIVLLRERMVRLRARRGPVRSMPPPQWEERASGKVKQE